MTRIGFFAHSLSNTAGVEDWPENRKTGKLALQMKRKVTNLGVTLYSDLTITSHNATKNAFFEHQNTAHLRP